MNPYIHPEYYEPPDEEVDYEPDYEAMLEPKELGPREIALEERGIEIYYP